MFWYCSSYLLHFHMIRLRLTDCHAYLFFYFILYCICFCTNHIVQIHMKLPPCKIVSTGDWIERTKFSVQNCYHLFGIVTWPLCLPVFVWVWGSWSRQRPHTHTPSHRLHLKHLRVMLNIHMQKPIQPWEALLIQLQLTFTLNNLSKYWWMGYGENTIALYLLVLPTKRHKVWSTLHFILAKNTLI